MQTGNSNPSLNPNEVLIENGSDLTDLPGSGNLKIKLTRENFLRGFYKITEFCELFNFKNEYKFFCSNKNIPNSFVGKIKWNNFKSRKDRELFINQTKNDIQLLPLNLKEATKEILSMYQHIVSWLGKNSEAERYFLRFIAKKYFLNPGFGIKNPKEKSPKGSPPYAGAYFNGSWTQKKK